MTFTKVAIPQLTKYDYEYRARFWMNAAIDMWGQAQSSKRFDDTHYFEEQAIEYSGRATDNYNKAKRC